MCGEKGSSKRIFDQKILIFILGVYVRKDVIGNSVMRESVSLNDRKPVSKLTHNYTQRTSDPRHPVPAFVSINGS